MARMTFSTRQIGCNILELTAAMEGASIVEDVAVYRNDKPVVLADIIDNLIDVANDCARFNGLSDIDFVQSICLRYLNTSEMSEVSERLLPAALPE
jgi:hypothetical protein